MTDASVSARALWRSGLSVLLGLILCQGAMAVDSDGDGVDDSIDVCSNTPPGIPVDPEGRPLGDIDLDCDADLADYALFQQSFTGWLPLCGNGVVEPGEVCDGIAGCTGGLFCTPTCDACVECLDETDCNFGEICNTAGLCECAPGYYDLNGSSADGCEFQLDPDAIYVSVDDPTSADDATCGLGPSPTGSGNHPCLSIYQGTVRAAGLGRSKVLVASGDYVENVDLVTGISLLGGYHVTDWTRDWTANPTSIIGLPGGGHCKTVVAGGIGGATTTVQGFVVYGADTTTPGTNSCAIYVVNSDNDLAIEDNVVYAGDGAGGTAGVAGTDGTNGAPGVSGIGAYDTVASCYEECTGSFELPGGPGGPLVCGGTDVSGGDGAMALCPDWDESTNFCMVCSSESQSAGNLSYGESGFNGGGAGGTGGYDAFLDYTCSEFLFGSGDCNCYLPTSGVMLGGDGSGGPDGNNGPWGGGCSLPFGTVVGGEWIGNAGAAASAGTAGGGGGGGGAGGGVESRYVPGGPCEVFGGTDIGGSGGGGGAGGCGGLGGGDGGAGGASFGIFVHLDAPPPNQSVLPVIDGNEIYTGNGGAGGNGGNGGNGGQDGIGGPGGPGGAGFPAEPYWCAAAGGSGGDGGSGGHGGGGGGACGGVSYGIFGSWTGPVTPVNWGGPYNTFVLVGSGGAGGLGGLSLGNPGTSGQAGADGDVHVLSSKLGD